MMPGRHEQAQCGQDVPVTGMAGTGCRSWQVSGMTAQPAPRPGGETFARPVHVGQRRYEAVRACLHEGTSLAQAAARFGYTRSALASLVRDFRAGQLVLLAEPGKPGRKSSRQRTTPAAG